MEAFLAAGKLPMSSRFHGFILQTPGQPVDFLTLFEDPTNQSHFSHVLVHFEQRNNKGRILSLDHLMTVFFQFFQ